MENKFKNMDPEKRDRIINSAFEEFGTNTYDKASTNNIVKRAGISKGSLFHYFKNKEELYKALEDFVFKKMMDEITAHIDWENTDIFTRIIDVAMIKVKVMHQYPYMLKFSEKLKQEMTIEEMTEKAANYAPTLLDEIYTKNINLDNLKEGIEYAKAIDMIRWTVEKSAEESFAKHQMFNGDSFYYEDVIKDVNEYLTVLRATLCKD